MAFQPGDVVMLKSGGHSMTVVSVAGEEITCLWITDAGALFRETIPAVALDSIFALDDEIEDEDDEVDDDEVDDDDESDEEATKPGRKTRA